MEKDKVFVVSMNRASDGAVSKLKNKLEYEGLLTEHEGRAKLFIVCGDRIETYNKALELFRDNKRIVHLWAGEKSQGTHDEVYRHSITLMSEVQLCTDKETKETAEKLLMSVDMKPRAYVVGNVYLDNMSFDNRSVPKADYDLILYNPPTLYDDDEINKDLEYINSIKGECYIWIEANGDKGSKKINMYSTDKNFPRPQFLSLLKNCKRFISNSSSIYYEAKALLKPEQIIKVGERNKNRSKGSDMGVKGASETIVKIIKEMI